MKGCCRLAGLAKRKQDNPSPAPRELPLHKGAFLCLSATRQFPLPGEPFNPRHAPEVRFVTSNTWVFLFIHPPNPCNPLQIRNKLLYFS